LRRERQHPYFPPLAFIEEGRKGKALRQISSPVFRPSHFRFEQVSPPTELTATMFKTIVFKDTLQNVRYYLSKDYDFNQIDSQTTSLNESNFTTEGTMSPPTRPFLLCILLFAQFSSHNPNLP
jgi:hypothetical protein